MKILHIVAGNLNGGAARGAYWLHCGLRKIGVESKILTNGINTFEDNSVTTILKSKIDKAFNLMRGEFDNLIVLLYPKRKKVIFSTGLFGIDFTKTREYREADIIHLHWINAGFVNIKHLSKINKPIVWTMRDMWPFTGGCHYSMECENYKRGCGFCVQLQSNKKYDLSRLVLYRKKKYLPKDMKVVGISSWLSEKAKESDVFRNFEIHTIPNAIDTKEFFPIEKKVAREILGIKTRKKIILVGATNVNDFYKGFGRYFDALKMLEKNKYFLCFFGILEEKLITDLGFEYKSFGYLHDNISLRLVYSSADVFVAPSMMEAFGKTLTEAMSCGTPVVCFDATGPKDIVTHQLDGYRAIPFDPSDLAKGIAWVIHHPEYEKLCQNAREKVVREFDSEVVAQKYVELYKRILHG
ncbi:glycosyltransferase family 4 protein [Thermospira aquatica]|uniref:Glycosyltransferase family 4 protein n=1 Tax=Thermospira aquatica TaxID=2828656 RepID=A0AAX3BF35_9SPIR|nr:glycosyltransferase family 4 protein [Thermospira aquatica]URA10849.1 glycosyltransferase family 4 protein [Thermospira aquatica]